MKKISAKRIAENVVQKRKGKKITQAQLAEATGINRSMIGRIENEEYMPTIEQLQALGDYLGFDFPDLFEEEEEACTDDQPGPDRQYNIAVAGTGYVGLSIATLLAQHNHVTAVDIVPEKVELINQRKSPIQDEYIEK